MRELEEELGLKVRPEALQLVDARTRSYGHETTFVLHLDIDPATIDLTEGQAIAMFSHTDLFTGEGLNRTGAARWR